MHEQLQNNNHRTLSAGCHIRKQAITNKENQEKQHQEDRHHQTLKQQKDYTGNSTSITTANLTKQPNTD